MPPALVAISKLIEQSEADLLAAWLKRLAKSGVLRSGRTTKDQLADQRARFLAALRAVLQGKAPEDVAAVGHVPVGFVTSAPLDSLERERLATAKLIPAKKNLSKDALAPVVAQAITGA